MEKRQARGGAARRGRGRRGRAACERPRGLRQRVPGERRRRCPAQVPGRRGRRAGAEPGRIRHGRGRDRVRSAALRRGHQGQRRAGGDECQRRREYEQWRAQPQRGYCRHGRGTCPFIVFSSKHEGRPVPVGVALLARRAVGGQAVTSRTAPAWKVSTIVTLPLWKVFAESWVQGVVEAEVHRGAVRRAGPADQQIRDPGGRQQRPRGAALLGVCRVSGPAGCSTRCWSRSWWTRRRPGRAAGLWTTRC